MRLPDEKAREEVIGERRRNVVIDAGAGTGKTETLVERLVHLVAPEDAATAIPIGRIAAVTFTRKAAGELRYRIREKLLSALETRTLSEKRRARLREALGGLDAAFVGTIHSFADRLLRLRPAEARLSPRYEIVEETSSLARLALERLLVAVETGRLAEAAEIDPGLAAEIESTIRDYLAAGFRTETERGEHHEWAGLDKLVARMIEKRDVIARTEVPTPPDLALVHAAARVASARIEALGICASEGGRFLSNLRRDFERIERANDPVLLAREVRIFDRGFAKDLQKARDFKDDAAAWDLYKDFRDQRKDAEFVDPVSRWMAGRLARIGPAVTGIYDAVKRDLEVVDQTDLLLRLREILAVDPHRRFFASLFDHLFVDEFQDTDPVQGEILRALVRTGSSDAPRPGAITIVGDAKQSIYRFRRADIEAYARFRDWLAAGGALVRSLSSNFRSVDAIVKFVNDRFSEIMGLRGEGKLFDESTGQVRYEKILGTVPSDRPGVRLIPIAGKEGRGLGAEDGREVEAEAMARYLVHLAKSRFLVRNSDRAEGTSPLQWSDVAVLGLSTAAWPRWFAAFDRYGIPYSARGGKVFAKSPEVQRFVLGLAAIADPEDGIAAAAYHRPPFWPLALAEVAAKGPLFGETGRVLRELRKGRFSRPPAETARRLLEETRARAFLEGGPNGAETLAQIRELVQLVDEKSRKGAGFDTIAAELRRWIDEPEEFDMPEPAGSGAVRFLTIHQAKGLEFPVVMIADAFQLVRRDTKDAWTVASDGTSAVVHLDGIDAEVPEGADLDTRERLFQDAERLRLAYVAATRAKDLLVIAAPDYAKSLGYLYEKLMRNLPDWTLRDAVYAPDRIPKWAEDSAPLPSYQALPAVTEDWRPTWDEGLARGSKPTCSPCPITGAAKKAVALAGEEEAESPHRREGRYGAAFGSTVHRAMELVLKEPSRSAKDAVALAAGEFELTEHLEEAAADVERAQAALRKIAGERLCEYPVAALREGVLLQGYIDLVVLGAKEAWVIDFKTDVPPTGDVEKEMPGYVAQVREYARILAESGICGKRRLRAGLLFTATGEVREIGIGSFSM